MHDWRSGCALAEFATPKKGREIQIWNSSASSKGGTNPETEFSFFLRNFICFTARKMQRWDAKFTNKHIREINITSAESIYLEHAII